MSALFPELPTLDRPAAAAAAGYDLVETWWPWPELTAADSDIAAFQSALEGAGTSLYLVNTHPGDARWGGNGLASIPEARDDFRRNADSVLAVADRLGACRINVLAGDLAVGVGFERATEALIENLTWLTAASPGSELQFLIEPLNLHDRPSYLLHDPSRAAAIIRSARLLGETDRIGMIADFYHLGAAGRDVVRTFDAHADVISHIQFADYPGRGAPGSGRLPLAEAIRHVIRAGWEDPIGVEFLGTADDPAARRLDVVMDGLGLVTSTTLRTGEPVMGDG